MNVKDSSRSRCFSLLLTLLFALGAVAAEPSVGGTSRPVKVRVSDPGLAGELFARGARRVADYGAFQLLEAPADVAALATRRGEGVQAEEEADFIELNAGRLDTRSAEAQARRRGVGVFAGKRLHLVQFAGPIKPEWLEALAATGVRLVHYIPHNAYLVQGSASALAGLQRWAASADFVQWDGDYAEEFKIHPRARLADAKGLPRKLDTDTFTIQLLDDPEENPATLALLDRIKLEPVRRQFRALHYLNLTVRIPPGRLLELAAQPDVISIRPYVEPHKMDERQDQIIAGNLSGSGPSGPGYLAWLASKGFEQSQFTASGFGVDVSDSGIDNGTTTPGHFGLYVLGNPALASRVMYARLEGQGTGQSTLQGCDGHGNLNAHIIAGYNDFPTGFPHTDSAGFHYGLGVCPFVKVGSSVIFDPDKFTNPNYNDLQSRAYRDGARISANSWGADTAGDYDADSQNYDALVRDAQPSGSAVPNAGNQQMVIVFAAGNAGPGAQTVGSPGTAKNVICVGAAENVHSHSTANGGNNSAGNDGCSTPDTEADNANDIASFSSRGPCSDGRKKPDLVAPGTHVTGGVGQSSTNTAGTGSALSCFKATGVCALPGGGTAGSTNNFFPLGQQFYTTSSGTSHSTPAVAGACALLRQWFLNQSLPPPSPAMTKAWLMNTARYLTGLDANDTLPSNSQGMGEVNLGMAFDDTPRVVRDQVSADKFTATGQTRTFAGVISDPNRPFRVTLAWTDAPGSTTGNAYNNDLDLTVTVGGQTYKGNVFSGAFSVPGGSADPRNNVESVFLPPGVSGSFVITVTAANINSDGVPNEAPSLDQDFALVIYNAQVTTGPLIAADSFRVVAESCLPTNGAVDPGETVTVAFALRNLGSANTTNLVATLQPAGGVANPSGPQTYGVLVAGGGAVTQAFTFTASAACGQTISPTLVLSDNGNGLGAVTFTIPLGQLAPVFAQNFDAVTAPALPSGWTTARSGAQALWVTTTAQRDTLPNSAFANDANKVGVSELVSPAIAITSASAQLTFRHYYNTENGWDGGVLEISIGGGAFTDILSAGGSFVTGGYNRSLNSSGNPLSGRQAWSGNSGGFITTTVNLPAAAAGQNVRFKWRCGTDGSIGGTGWYVDSIVVSDLRCCAASVPLEPLVVADTASLTAESCLPTNGVIDPGETVTVQLALKNLGNAATSNLVATLLTTGGVLNAVSPQSYGVLPTNGAPVSRPFTFTATASCGDGITATLALQDGTNVLTPVSFAFTVGRLVTAYTQDFDNVTAPVLPAGWSSSASGAQSVWVTTTALSDTGPNAVFSPDPSSVGENELVSEPILLPATPSQLTFRHQYDLEASSSGTTGYDVGVLEISIGGGPFQDVEAAGGSFASGGYTHVTSSSYSNPLAGRSAWSGNSGGFIQTIINLPPAAAGQPVRFRWRCGTDSSVAATGWYVDTARVIVRECCVPATAPLRFEAVNPTASGQVELTLSGTPGSPVTILRSEDLSQWTPLGTVTNLTGTVQFIDATAGSVPQRFYRATSP